jgi:muramidase (phage lysozyme)
MIGNLAAFLTMIAHGEGTDRVCDPYRATFQGESSPGIKKPMHLIMDFADHPAVTGEWKGESLAFLGPRYAGEISTAAGRYQITKPTWLRLKALLQLPDFGPASQDLACQQLIRERGALNLVLSGQVGLAITQCREEWASLPGGSSGQPQAAYADLLSAYGAAGGAFA